MRQSPVSYWLLLLTAILASLDCQNAAAQQSAADSGSQSAADSGSQDAQAQQSIAEGSVARPNVLFISIDDLRNDLGCLGAVHARTPHLDEFATTARVFSHHYVQVPTCGASRCALLSGRYPSLPAHVGNNAICDTQADWVDESLPSIFRQHGYRTLSLGKITHYPGGLTGRNWADGAEELPGVWDRAWIPDGPWTTPQAIMHGYANGVARIPGRSLPWQSFDGPDTAFPDAWVADEATTVLEQLSNESRPWFFAVGFFKPHLPFAAPKKWFDEHSSGVPDLPQQVTTKPAWPSGWHSSGEFRGNYGHADGLDPSSDVQYSRQLRQAYAASVSYMDAQVGRLLDALQNSGQLDRTIVVIWSDHGFLLGEHAIWGKHCLYEHAMRSPLMIRHPQMQRPGIVCGAVVETVDLLPTLTDLCHLKAPDRLHGRSLRRYLQDPSAESHKPALGFWTNGQKTIRTDRWRLIVQQKGIRDTRLELFDYQTDPLETQNIAADRPEVVEQLLTDLRRLTP